MLITNTTPSTDDLQNVTVITWTNSNSVVTIGAGNSVTGQQYILDNAGLTMQPGSTIRSDNYIYEYGTLTAIGGPWGPYPLATVTISSPNVILETGSTVTATGGGIAMPGLLINGGVEQYGTLDVALPPLAGVVSIVGTYTINLSATTNINPSGSLSYTGAPPLYDEGALYMKGGTLTASLIYVDNLLDSQAADTITGDVQVNGGTLAVDTTLHALTITGNLTMPNGTLSLILNGGGGNSSVNVSGAITLGKDNMAPTLDVTAITPVAPVRNVWALMTAASISGDFNPKNLPPLPPPPPVLGWSTSIQPGGNGVVYFLGD